MARAEGVTPVIPARSLVIPMYNEAGRIRSTLTTLARSPLNGPELEIVLVDDGSLDGTVDVAEKVLANVGLYDAAVLTLDGNRGKGAAVRHGMLRASGLTRVYVDADLSVTMDDIERCFTLIEEGTAEVVYATRAHAGSDLRHSQPAHRVASGRAFNFFLRRMGLTAERDTQCGLKGFSASAANALFGALRTNGFAFDVELLARARHDGIRTSPMAVSWNHSDGSRVRPLRDGLDMARSAIAIRRAVGPERPLERAAWPERPLERAAWPERPLERAARPERTDGATIMAPEAYSSMALVEADHWWFRGKHELVIGEIERHTPHGGLVVDVGAGTGGFLGAVRAHGHPAIGVEYDGDALELASRAHPQHALVRGSATALPLRDGVAVAVTALDLIEHLDDDVAALGSFARVVDVGGVVIVAVPAYSWMWSEHDVRLGHRRRYTRRQLTAVAQQAGLEVIRCTHFHSWLTPPAFALRRTPLGRLMKRPAEEASYVNPSVNQWLYRVTRLERTALGRVAIPVGLSILLVARRPVSH